ncbi:MAG: FecR family protein [Melioribacteraceae bacterium]|nr:FecR family protein [Melioribacteraceae bacterium]MCF8263680.1 FecR family protein [Melioribacteraceae bacterium]MCF8431074.1 FecR family protein [Melioribacteraceae bacterium]
MKNKLPDSFYNLISMAGAVIAAITFSLIIILAIVTTILDRGNAYFGLIIYMILPGVMIFGLILIPIGMYFEKKKSEENKGKLPIINLNTPQHRNATAIFLFGTAILLFASAIGGYEAFHFSESDQFCGEICHEVMKPEYTAYQTSAHARVGCAECHVGSGADWFVKAKITGLYQVYAVMANTYERPIPTPIKNLRPARETCEQCHWPEKFYSSTMRKEIHYLSDEKNTRWDINLTVKVGAESSAKSLSEGSHWHISPNTKVEYISTDEKRQEIPWVRYTNLETGEITVYDGDDSIDPDSLGNYEIRTMDCMDCHNRPSHNYRPPAVFINEALARGDVSPELPEIKSLTMELLGEEYPTTDSAMAAIRNGILEFYSEDYEDIFEEQKELIEKSIVGVQNAFNQNIFPEMKVRWDYYPNNIGHFEFDGCFRCHDSYHESEEGKVISNDCNQCHVINAQGPADSLQVAKFGEPLEFRHPVDIDEMWKESLCTDCHTGLNP